MKPNNTKQNEWKDRFEDEFYFDIECQEWFSINSDTFIEGIEKFIQSEIDQAKEETRQEVIEKIKGRIGFLRQWLNETSDRTVTNQDLEFWLILNLLEDKKEER